MHMQNSVPNNANQTTLNNRSRQSGSAGTDEQVSLEVSTANLMHKAACNP